MTWFFAVVVVALIGVVAIVAAGHGGELAEVHDDRRDVLVPADRALTAADLRSVRFTTGLSGYRTSEVDALLDRLAAELEERERERPPYAEPGGAGEPSTGPA